MEIVLACAARTTPRDGLQQFGVGFFENVTVYVACAEFVDDDAGFQAARVGVENEAAHERGFTRAQKTGD